MVVREAVLLVGCVTRGVADRCLLSWFVTPNVTPTVTPICDPREVAENTRCTRRDRVAVETVRGSWNRDATPFSTDSSSSLLRHLEPIGARMAAPRRLPLSTVRRLKPSASSVSFAATASATYGPDSGRGWGVVAPQLCAVAAYVCGTLDQFVCATTETRARRMRMKALTNRAHGSHYRDKH